MTGDDMKTQSGEKQRFRILELAETPDELKKLPAVLLPEAAAELRRFIVQSVSETGGHLASSLGAVELALALHYVFNTPDDAIVWDVGHQAYAHKILTGRRDRMETLRQTGGLSGFPKRSESEYDAFGAGHSSTSVSAALGMAVAASLTGHRDRWHIAVIGDGALTGGMALEALNDAGAWKDDIRLLIILNDNNYSISAPAGALSRGITKLVSTPAFLGAREKSKRVLKTVPKVWELAKRMETQAVNFISPPSSLFSAFDLKYFGPVDGHDVQLLVEVLANLKKQRGPIVLHVTTKKGKGYAPAEENPTAYHGVGAFDPEAGVQPKTPSAPTYSEVFGRWLCSTAERDPKLYAITPAMTEGSGMVEFARRFPDRFRDVSIAEQHAVTYAAGLACGGMKPVVAVYSTFLQRAYDQFEHDVALQHLPVLFAVDRGGLVGADGPTHHGLFDIACARQFPGVAVFTPSSEAECTLALNTAYALEGPALVRYPRGKGPGDLRDVGPEEKVPFGKARKLSGIAAENGQRVSILSFGALTESMKTVASELGAALYDMRFAKPLDREAVLEAAGASDLVVTIEEGVIAGGAGDGVLELLAAEGREVPVLQLGVPDEFIPHGGTADLLKLCGLDTESVIKRIRERLKRKEEVRE